MTDFEKWQALVSGGQGADLTKYELPLGSGKGNYPLLLPDTEAGASVEGSPLRWRVRVVLSRELEEEKSRALEESGTELVAADSLGSFEEVAFPSHPNFVQRGNEGLCRIDLNFLKNIAEIRRLRANHPEVENWVLVSEGGPEDDPEGLVGETLRQLTGVLAGCEVLEIRQAIGESFQSLWGRLNVSRLLAFESELLSLPDPVVGAGLFEALQERI